MIRVLIVDDHPVVRSGLEMILSKEPNIAVVGAVGNGHRVIGFLRSNPCDVLVLDLTMPGMTGLEVIGQLKREKKEVKVLILSMHKEEMYVVAAFKAGAAGYLTKECAPNELIRAVKKVAAGGKYMSPSSAEKMAFEIGRIPAGKAPHETLTSREFQVMRMIAAGLHRGTCRRVICECKDNKLPQNQNFGKNAYEDQHRVDPLRAGEQTHRVISSVGKLPTNKSVFYLFSELPITVEK